MSDNANIMAAGLPPSSLPIIAPYFLCDDYINGFCRRGEQCNKSHEICTISSDSPELPRVQSPPNYLCLDPRTSSRNEQFEHDGPGVLSNHGPRHDNDYVEIQDIKILPTTDEILSTRPPYVPKKDENATHHLPLGQARLLDIHFRQLRYENVEAIIDSCYHASQQLVRLVHEPQVIDYDDRLVTPRGNRYSLFRDVRFEELAFSYLKGVTVRLSFACPKALRGRRLGSSKQLEDGMLVVLIGLDENNSLSTTFMEVSQRQSTEAMRSRTGNDLRGQFFLRVIRLISNVPSIGRSILRG